jgi:hypothetical protein
MSLLITNPTNRTVPRQILLQQVCQVAYPLGNSSDGIVKSPSALFSGVRWTCMAACQQLVFDRCPAVPSTERRDTSLMEKYYPGSMHPGRIGSNLESVGTLYT